MNLLAFDTSTELCSVALALDGECLSRDIQAGNRHSELLLPMVQELLAEAGIGLRQLDGIAFGKGPGSFTGLRIGCGVAQGLALGADLPVVGVVTLEAMAWGSGHDKVIACLDARMHEVYCAAYARGGDGLIRHVDPGVFKPDQAPVPPGSGWVGCGTGFAAYPEVLAARFGQGMARGLADVWPHARAIAELARPVFTAGGGQAADRAEPFYVRDKVALKTCER